MILGLTPSDIDSRFPAKFSTFRRGQLLALARTMDSTKRHVDHSMPVGEGKSLYYIALALMTSTRALISTTTTALQTQLTNDFSPVGLVDMRGRNNYPCSHKDAINCEDGQHYKCDRSQCPYEIAREKMMASPLVVSNPPYIIGSQTHGRGMGEFDLLICDEAHSIPSEICKAVAVEFHYHEASKIGTRLPSTNLLNDWINWASEQYQSVAQKLEEFQSLGESEKKTRGKTHPHTSREISAWTKIQSKAASIIAAQGEWVVDKIGDGYRLEPVWASDHAHVLFRNIPRIVQVSATMVEKTLTLEGLTREDYDYYEYASSFPSGRSPVYILRGAQIDHKSDSGTLSVWVSKIDNIIRRRLDRKGIIHSVSFDRASYIKSHSEFSSLMLLPEKGKKGDTDKKIEEFKAAAAPRILISPSITTGYDFPGSQCEYNIIAKVPFLDSRDKVTKARSDGDPDYSSYVTAQTIVQALGRAMRGEWDQCESFVVDGHMAWFIRKNHKLFPFWFHRLVSSPSAIPGPPAPLKPGTGNTSAVQLIQIEKDEV